MAYVASKRACYFRLGEQLLAIGSEHLLQIVAVGSVTRVPRVGPELLGLFSVRGAVLPLIDLRPLLGLATTSVQATKVAALIEFEGHPLALHLDEVFGFFPYQDAPSPNREINTSLQALSLGTVVHQDLQAVMIDVGEVMKSLENQLVPV